MRDRFESTLSSGASERWNRRLQQPPNGPSASRPVMLSAHRRCANDTNVPATIQLRCSQTGGWRVGKILAPHESELTEFMKVIYKITYPNGKIYIGKDLTDSAELLRQRKSCAHRSGLREGRKERTSQSGKRYSGSQSPPTMLRSIERKSNT